MSSPDDVRMLLARDHYDPHRLLGRHPVDGATVVRTWRPGAISARVLPEAGDPVELTLSDPAGLFEGSVAGQVDRYRVQVSFPDGHDLTYHDAYSFPPTLGELDLHLVGEGRHEDLDRLLGAHPRELDGVQGTAFAVWAPGARSVSVVGDFNGWDGRLYPMRSMGSSGVWEIFVPGVEPGARYKFEVRNGDGSLALKADPLAFATEVPPQTASVVARSEHVWADGPWIEARRASRPHEQPLSVYEVHLPSWRLNPIENNRPLSYAELAEELSDYALDLGFTHVELMPVMEHPFSGSWGYQVSSYFAPTARLGTPDDFRRFVDRMHERGVGVLLDWVPAHFPKDAWALARFDGTALYEHADPRRGEHQDWGTLIFNFGRHEVRNFLLSSAIYWLREYHADGLRVDAVASMLYRDYSREAGEWVPNEFGGREDLEAIAFLREMNAVVHAQEPGTITAAEESTAWPSVSRPVDQGGLGFDLKWNMGWMHDTLAYFTREPIHRRWHHHELTFGLLYAFTEQFILPLSHDEVVHGKGSLIDKMPGDRWQKFANLRALYAYMWAHPGKKLLFMGGEIGQWQEWSHERSLDWHLLQEEDHAGVQRIVRDLNHRYRDEPALWQVDFEPDGFAWLEANDADSNALAFARFSRERDRTLVCVCNFSPVPRHGYRVGLPVGGRWREVLNSDAAVYGGSDVGNAGLLEAQDAAWHGQSFSAEVTLPPLGVVWFVPEGQGG
jgi:1,4-alpha-glucan branching enzyme